MVSQLEQPSIQKEPLDDFYGMATFRINGRLYAADALTKAEAAAWEIAGECLDLIETELILKHSGLPNKAAPLIRHLQDGYYFTEVELLKTIMEDPHALTEKAISRYGRQYFLKLYDQNEEQSLDEFPHDVAAYILTVLGWPERAQVCIYKLD